MFDSLTSVLLLVVPTVLAILLFRQLDKHWPGGTVVALVAFALFAISFIIPDDNTREINLIIGLLRINGIIGILLGSFSALRHKLKGRQPTDTETKPTPAAQTNRNKCPQCGLVNRVVDSSCQRCGTQLQKETAE
jgi:hypothetical protein